MCCKKQVQAKLAICFNPYGTGLFKAPDISLLEKRTKSRSDVLVTNAQDMITGVGRCSDCTDGLSLVADRQEMLLI